MLDGFGMPESIHNTALNAIQGNLVEAGMSIYDVKKVLKKSKTLSDKKLVGEQSLAQLLKPDQLESIYLNIPKWIEEITLLHQVNFVFLIDDLDRCLPENTLKMLESIKLFLDVPSCAFVLAVDDDVVERGVVHHYRDYLSIYHSKDTADAKGVLQHELPITGHEYLEKMIQLPMRLPVIDTVNVRAFLEEHSGGWKEYLKDELLSNSKHSIDMTSTSVEKPKESYESLLDFFESKIPPKPRKIKRTALLFHSKLQLFDKMKIECHDMYILVAKITLLELFAPKLLRFIQNNGYDSMYNRLVEFRKKRASLTEFEDIKTYIERKVTTKDLSEATSKSEAKQIQDDRDYYTQKEQQLYTRMMHIVKEHYTSRIQFDLDTVFTRDEDKKDLQKIIEMREKVKVTTKVTHELQSSEFFEKLFKADDVQSWRDAFKVDKLFEEGKATLTDNQLKNIMSQVKKKGLHLNYEWRNAIIPYITGEQLKDDLYFEMCPTTVTKGEFKTFVDAVSYETEAEKNESMYVYNGKEWEVKKDASWKKSYIKDETDKHPVVGVSWNDAKAYIEWKNNTDEKHEYVLPTEHEWYLACNNGKDTKWHFGDDESQLKEYAWYRENSDMKTHEVATRKSNDFGLYDMHGNVWEWGEDWHDEDTKVLRGGSWFDYAINTESSNRFRYDPTFSSNDVGFRLQRALRS
jgi:regulator of replication initiation timing